MKDYEFQNLERAQADWRYTNSNSVMGSMADEDESWEEGEWEEEGSGSAANEEDLADVHVYLENEASMVFEPRVWLYVEGIRESRIRTLNSVLPDYEIAGPRNQDIDSDEVVLIRNATFESKGLFVAECRRVADILANAADSREWHVSGKYHGDRRDAAGYQIEFSGP